MSDDKHPSASLTTPQHPSGGLSKLPWEGALYTALRQLEGDLADAQAQIAELRAANSQLHSQLQRARTWARTKTENWKLRQDAWRVERRELLDRLEELSSLSKEKSPSTPDRDGEVRL